MMNYIPYFNVKIITYTCPKLNGGLTDLCWKYIRLETQNKIVKKYQPKLNDSGYPLVSPVMYVTLEVITF